MLHFNFSLLVVSLIMVRNDLLRRFKVLNMTIILIPDSDVLIYFTALEINVVLNVSV